MSLGGPGFTYTKGRVKSWSERKTRDQEGRGIEIVGSGKDCMNEYVRNSEMSLFSTEGLVAPCI